MLLVEQVASRLGDSMTLQAGALNWSSAWPDVSYGPQGVSVTPIRLFPPRLRYDRGLMKSFWSIVVILSVLFASLEGAADVAIDGIPHGDEVTHEQEFGHSLDRHGGEQSDTELDGDHCDHCCHGHTSSLVAAIAAFSTTTFLSGQPIGRSANILNFAQAPPTPPPNA